MPEFLALVAIMVAIAALVSARRARADVLELRRMILRWQRPVVAPEPVVVPPPPPPVVVAPEIPPPPPPAPAKPRGIDWENVIGIKLFSWIAGIALVLSAVFLFKYSIDHGWLRPAFRATMGIVTGVGLLIACELRVARNYRFTANAMDGAGIAILYATLFSLHGRWHLWPASAALLGMLLVTAAAVFLSTRRDSIFIALLGLLGGFATPALLSSGENRPLALFSYLLLLNGGISWIAFKKRWPLLTALSVALTAFYQWSWVDRYLTRGQLPLAAAIFLVFAAIAAAAFWRELEFRRIGAAGAVLPLLFAFFTAVVPEYGASSNVLFGFLMLVAIGLAAIAILRGPSWLHSLGGAAVLVTFFLWLIVSYTSASWPFSLVWLAGFAALYLVAGLRVQSIAIYTAPLLFFAFIGLALREPQRFLTLSGAMFALLAIVYVYALQRRKPFLATIAIAFASMAMMALDDAPFWLAITAQTILFAAAFVLAWLYERHAIAIAALPLFIAAQFLRDRWDEDITIALVLYALFLLYPLVLGARVKRAFAPHFAAVIASVVFFFHAYYLRDKIGFAEYAGYLPLAQSLLLILLLWRLLRLEPHPARLAFVAASALAFLTAAIPVQLANEWVAIAFALEAASLAWLFTRVPHRGLLVWSGGLAAFVLLQLLANATEYAEQALGTYLVCAAAMFYAAWRTGTALRRFAATCGAIELFALVNIEIAKYYSAGGPLTFNFMGASLAQDLTYTIAWALFAIATLIAGIALHARGARVAALGLLFVTILKCFLHDLARLGGLYRVGSLFGLAVSLVVVGLMLQKFVMMRREPPPSTT